MDKKVGKKEILLLLIIFAAAVIGYFVFQKLQSTPGAQVKVTVDGTVYGTYDLYTTGEKAKKIQIKNAEGTVTNTLVIENGKADMISADCPDKLCVNQNAIFCQKLRIRGRICQNRRTSRTHEAVSE